MPYLSRHATSLSHPLSGRSRSSSGSNPRRLNGMTHVAVSAIVVILFLWSLAQLRSLHLSNKSDPLAPAEKGERTVGVAVTVTGCAGYHPDGARVSPDGAAVMHYSVMRQHKLKSENAQTRATPRYRYHFYVIYHPSARDCVGPLADLNFTLMERESPVLPQDIRGSQLRESISKSGCCGEKELLKFEAFTLTQHDAIVLLDMDTMVLNPLDEALDLLLDGKVPADAASHLMYPERPIPEDVWILHTSDFEMVWPDVEPKPAQGGFAIFKPNRTIYSEVMDIVREGKWDRRWGWGPTRDSSTGWFYGVETFQGLVPYYFHVLKSRQNHVVLLNWCRYNHMSVAHTEPVEIPGTNSSKETCRNNREECEDCRKRKLEEISSAHFTICQKPWWCEPQQLNPKPDDKKRLCYQLHRTWFEFRSQMEASWGRTGRGSTTEDKFVAQFRGYCSANGEFGYEPIRLPYGRPVNKVTNESRASSSSKMAAAKQSTFRADAGM